MTAREVGFHRCNEIITTGTTRWNWFNIGGLANEQAKCKFCKGFIGQ